jgi:DNA-binding CsgD family transcriptional regulator
MRIPACARAEDPIFSTGPENVRHELEMEGPGSAAVVTIDSLDETAFAMMRGLHARGCACFVVAIRGPRRPAAAGPGLGGLSPREVDVLQLAADGLDTEEIAQKLCYSKRTIANILHDVITRFNLNNRTHAVAYTIRTGLI